jgi:hypothetical protein
MSDLSTKLIYLDDEDDIVSIRDRLDWARAPQVVLVLPAMGDLLVERLDLVLLRRHADSLRLEIGLVTGDGRVTGQARALGIPTFSSVEASQHSRRGWWRGRKRREPVGRPTHLDEADRREMRRRLAPRPAWQRWLWRYTTILIFFLALAAFFVGVAYAVPGATITLKPEVERLQVSRQIVADPLLEPATFSGASVPARLLAVTVEWQAEVATTGTIEVADSPARGKVLFVNQLGQPVTVPAGTRVSTTAGSSIVFQVLAPVELPDVVGGTAEADVIAVEPGPGGNVAVNQINRVEGSLSLQLQVRNLEPLTGGGVRLVRSVTAADQDRLRAQVLQQLQVLALAEMESSLSSSEFMAQDSLRVARIVHETFSHFAGEQSDRMVLVIRAELQGTAVDETQAVGLMYEELAVAVRPGYELAPDSISFRRGELLGVDGQGRVSFMMIGEGAIAARLPLDDVIQEVAGQDTAVAMAYLYQQLPLRDYPSVRILPNWFDRMPYLPARIRVQVDTNR